MATAHAPQQPRLPVELWLQIFRWATLTPSTSALNTTKYRPFEVIDAHGFDAARCTKRALVLVCKRWKAWATPLLYEDLLLPQEDEQLARALRYGEARAEGTDALPCARLVRRVLLPYSSTVTESSAPLQSVEALSQCPSVEVLVRTADVLGPSGAYDFEAECPPLPSIKRIDWWHLNEAARTGGINSLPHVLAQAPNTEYLSIGGEIWQCFLHAPPAALPNLTTLRLRRVNAFFLMLLCRWSLPALTHLVFDHIQSADIFSPLWETFGPQVRTAELGVSLKFYIRDFLALVFAGCPQLEELNYYLFFTHVPHADRPQESLRTLGLHAHANSFFTPGTPEFWSHIAQHFHAFDALMFPALQRVSLYGDWSDVVGDQQFDKIVEPLRERGCAVEVA
ncbi:hypothetical protein BD413DRAFT_607912 [Trametes elegans]|nr:hypothetical protein BD413DRAFT_607912 [Trametes elegans]